MFTVAIVGGGFGGLALARSLRKQNVRVVLISDRHGFRYCPALYRTATGFTMRSSAIPLKDIVSDLPNVRLHYGRATSIDEHRRLIKTGSGEQIHYDIAVLSLGSVPNYFGIPGVEKHAYSITSPQEIFKLRKHLHDYVAKQSSVDKSYVVVGAGATGVEVAAGMASYVRMIAKRHKIKRPLVKIELVDSAHRPLPGLSKKASRTTRRRLNRVGVHFRPHSFVKEESETTLVTNKQSFHTNTVIWSAGFKINSFYQRNKHLFGFDKRGKVYVDEYMRAEPRIFVIGDNASTPFSGYAQTAVHDAHYVAKQIRRMHAGKRLRPYKIKRPFSVVPVGKRWAVLEYGRLSISGWLGAIVRDLADFIGYLDVMRLSQALKVWRGRNDSEEYCPVCKNI